MPRDYDHLVDWVVARLPTDRPFALLAESFSGPIAIKIAARRPVLLTHLVLAATFLRSPLKARLALFGALARPPLFARPPPSVAAARARAALDADERAPLSSVTVPTLMLSATRDRLLRPGQTEAALASRPSTRIASVDGPHLVLQRRPRECLAEIDRFLAAAS